MASHLIAHEPPDLLKLLAHELRWKLVQQLVHSDLRVQELAERVARPLNLVSYHLAQLRRGALVIERRSSSDARDVYYSLDLRRLQRLYHDAGVALHPALIECREQRKEDRATAVAPARRSPVRVLFLCTHNSARSQMAEAMLRRLGGDAVEVYSAGSEIREVHPLAIETMAERGIDIRGQRSKSVEEFAGQRFDYIITVCDRMREVCPVFPGEPEQVHWSIPDPAAVEAAMQKQAFLDVAEQLAARLDFFVKALAADAMADATQF
ncbi:MAG: hypothetical protein WHS90_08285 [Caldilinea sp.]|uniref:arsenate reductase/protein-tyrosine-phosphatase family protein n=1 Tax=Caldilinea sp. TaxID=2293560 RepID=UPI0030B16EA2